MAPPTEHERPAPGRDPASAETDRAALVTGAAHRIGRAIALGLAADGWAVAVHYNQSARDAAALVEEIEASGNRAVALDADLTDHAATAELVPRAREALGPLRLLVNNASQFHNDTVRNATLESWQRHIDPNLRAPFFLSQAFAEQAPADGGNVINLLDQRVWKPTPYFASYTVSKIALWGLTRTLAMALAPGIRVNAIGPGPTLPNERQTADQFDRQWRSTPLGRGTTPEEIVEAVRFILAAPALTGQMIALDGGQHLPWPPPDPESETVE